MLQFHFFIHKSYFTEFFILLKAKNKFVLLHGYKCVFKFQIIFSFKIVFRNVLLHNVLKVILSEHKLSEYKLIYLKANQN